MLWTGPAPLSGGKHHHDVQITPAGDALAIASSTNSDGDAEWEGFRIEAVTPFTGAVTWSWDSQAAVDAGDLPPRNGGPYDLYHANAVSWVDDAAGEGVIVSVAQLHRILRIDVATGQVVWQLGRGRDFVLLDPDGGPLGDAEWFYFQHDPELNGDRMLIHDNGLGRPDPGLYSRAIELELDTVAMTATAVWVYEEPGWYEPVWGDADRLPNGHVLVVQGHSNGAGDPSRRSAILEIDPATQEIVRRRSCTSAGADTRSKWSP